jgi:hypothetical protein
MANADMVILQAKGPGAFHWTWTGSTGLFRQPRMYFPSNVVGLTSAEATLNMGAPGAGNVWAQVVDYNATPLPPPWPGSANGLGPGVGTPRSAPPEDTPPPPTRKRHAAKG